MNSAVYQRVKQRAEARRLRSAVLLGFVRSMTEAARASLKSKRANVLPIVVVIAGVAIFAGNMMLQTMTSLKNTAERGSDLILSRAVLESVANYTAAGMKRRWCFTDNWVRDEICLLDHPRSTERLLLTPPQVAYINELKVANPDLKLGSPVTLDEFSTVLTPSALPVSHPLASALQQSGAGKLSKLEIKVQRTSDLRLPIRGREGYVRLTVTGTIADAESTEERKVTLVTQFAVMPRELSAFTLILPRDLYLDRPVPLDLKPGNHVFPVVGYERSQVRGIRFESPVYVNRDVHIPIEKELRTPTATFVEKLVLGNGILRRGDQPFATQTAGGAGDDYFASIRGYSGLLAGVERDGEFDRGLQALIGDIPAYNPDPSLLQMCIRRNQVLSNLSATDNSSLVWKSMSSNMSQETFRLSWTELNFFSEQTTPHKVDHNHKSGGNSAHVQEPTIVKGGDYVTTVEIESFNENYVKQYAKDPSKAENARVRVDLGRGGSVVLTPKFLDKDIYIKRIDDLEEDRDKLKDKLEDEKDPKKAEALEKQINAINKEINDLKVLRDRAIAAEKDPPRIRIEVFKVVFNMKDQPHQVDVRVSVENQFNMLTGFRARVWGLDVGFSKGHQNRDLNKEPAKSRYNNALTLNYKDSNSAYDFGTIEKEYGVPTSFARTDGKLPVPPETLDVIEDYAALNEACAPSSPVSSFSPVAWDVSFAAASRHSWRYRPIDGILELDAANSSATPVAKRDFLIYSTVTECRIKASAEVVAGFFTCDLLTIEPRDRPLRIIGTIIALNSVIDDSALRHGITMSSIHNQSAIDELRRLGILYGTTSACPGIDINNPLWHPYPNLSRLADQYRCLPISLRDKSNPMQWSTVDPDCGLLPGASATSCKSRPQRLKIKFLSSEVVL
ncbi:MAG TPA: hypothetical protein PLZ57_15680 [Pseudobdellovibrionaceae bacterium]|nr:hypothetical protein [Pseudobdellovibrionaceae bacterium]